MKNKDFSSRPHRRYNPLTNEWILVSPQRTKRPWLGKRESLPDKKRPSFDPNCYMCPGNTRANGKKNPIYQNTYVFPNDFSPIIDTRQKDLQISTDIYQAKTVKGECKVVCFSPRHDLTLAQMSTDKIVEVINTWIKEIKTINHQYRWAQIFENKGKLMGCSNPHPHCQIWVGDFVPNEIKKEDTQQKMYYQKHNSVLLLDYLKNELKKKERIVIRSDLWTVLVPFWAVWPFEILLLPNIHFADLEILPQKNIEQLARMIKKLLSIYDKLFDTSMPYSMGWHFAPLDKKGEKYWQLHAHYYPPLLRSATVKKFMVGYEMLAEPQRDITPEQAAIRLKSVL